MSTEEKVFWGVVAVVLVCAAVFGFLAWLHWRDEEDDRG